MHKLTPNTLVKLYLFLLSVPEKITSLLAVNINEHHPPLSFLQEINFVLAARIGSLQDVCDGLEAGIDVDATDQVCYRPWQSIPAYEVY